MCPLGFELCTRPHDCEIRRPNSKLWKRVDGTQDDEACVDLRFNRRNEWLPRLGVGVLLVAVGGATLGAVAATTHKADAAALTSVP